uniref:YoeB-like toxin of type II toxin-antitoxin system n=1 Tax=Candidatus Kentrum sp. FW TaxID=2126338 RepID=A0A450TIN6_9GAMM|nr:MAG: YoeB-like toxin of type II toxin-antitoxin system [Candidatus Kentron sp. FW]
MIYKVRILKNASRDLDWLRRHDRASYIKFFDLTRQIMEVPRTGIGKPKRLRYFEEEVYSR